MASQSEKQTIAIHILLNIFRNKDNQRIKFAQLKECNMKNIFLEPSCTNCGGETIPDSFLKINIEHISGSIV